MTHQIDVFSAQKCSCLSRCVRARIVGMKIDPSLAVGFPDRSELTRYSSGTIATCPVFPKKQAIICWKFFVREQLLLDLTHLETPIQSTAVYFWAHTGKSTIHHLS